MIKILNVIMPTYNAEKTIIQALGSLMAQSGIPKKFILTIIDDGSTDDTMNIVENFKKYLPIRTICLPKNQGVANARQKGLDSNECDLIAFLDSDDKFFPYTVHMYNREMKTDAPDVLYSNFISEQKGREVLVEGKKNITWFHGKVYRKSFLEKYKIKIPQVKYNEDSGFSTIVHEISENKAYIPEISYFWSSNPDSITRGKGDFNSHSFPEFISSIHFAFEHLKEYQDIYDKFAFYSQINNFYNSYMEGVFRKKEWLEEAEKRLKLFFKTFWIESNIRPEKMVRSFLEKNTSLGLFLPELTPIQWLSKMTEIEYINKDFETEDKLI